MGSQTSRVHPDGNKVAAICAILTFCMLALVAARLYTRLYIVKSFGLDDIFMFLGCAVCALLVPGVFIGIYKYEFGFSPEIASPSSMAAARIIAYVYLILMHFGLGLTKASLMLTIKRFARSSLLYLYIIHIMVITVLIFTVFSTLMLALGCRPISAAWKYVEPGHYKCPGVKTYTIIMLVHMATDFVTLVLPMPLFFRLKVPILQRSFLIFLFTLGSISVVASILRLFAIMEVTRTSPWNYLGIEPFFWGVVESHIAIICGCLPPLNAFIRYFLKGKSLRAITPNHTQRQTRAPSFSRELGVSSRALNWPNGETWDGDRQTPHNGSLDLELSSWGGSSRCMTEGLCLRCVDCHELYRRHERELSRVGGPSVGEGPSSSRDATSMALETDTISPLPSYRNRPSSCGELEGSRRRGMMHKKKRSWSG